MSPLVKKTADNETAGKTRSCTTMKGAVLLLFLAAFILFALGMNASFSRADTACDCTSCHTTPHNTTCSGCHDSPPQTGTHLIHYGSAPLDSLPYGDTGVSSTDSAYKFGCGNCHPLDAAKHGDGIVEVELYNPNAPAGSIKARNPSNALYTAGSTTSTYAGKLASVSFSYSNGTCNNVYCHSGYAVSSGSVGDPTGVDQYGNPTYAPYTVTRTRVYKATPTWGTSGTFTTCAECHAFPLTSSYPAVQAGVGDSHQWIDDRGNGNLHAYNMGFDPLSCRTCHFGIVTAANTWTRNSTDVTTYNPVLLADRSLHVNGSANVNFYTANIITYGTHTYNLSGATYDPAAKTCSNVACHQKQTRVTWGAPYRWWNQTECNLCHKN